MQKTRQKAIDQGERYYKTGKPCKNGHKSKRITINGACHECDVLRQQKRRKEISAALKGNVSAEIVPAAIEPVKPKKSIRFEPPTVEEVSAYIREKGYNVDAEQFVDFYESKGWLVGKNKMKSWQAAVRTWQRRNEDNTNGQKTSQQRTQPSRAKRVSDELDRIAAESIRREGLA